jgi:hypothetical protein
MSADTGKVADGGHLMTKEKPKILPLPNGPYYLLNDMKPKIVENLQNSKGDLLSMNSTWKNSASNIVYGYDTC